jgi:hypothetical protein
MKKLVMVNPITLKPTKFPFPPELNPILSGQYQNAAEVDPDKVYDEMCNGPELRAQDAEIGRLRARAAELEAALNACIEAMGKWQENYWEEYASAISMAWNALRGAPQ